MPPSEGLSIQVQDQTNSHASMILQILCKVKGTCLLYHLVFWIVHEIPIYGLGISGRYGEGEQG